MNCPAHVRRIVLSALLIASSGCCRLWGTTRSEEMQTLASALTKLAAAVEAYVSEVDPPAGMDERALIVSATSHDPGLRAPFEEYLLRVKWEGRHAVVLVCDREGREGLLEDAGCTARSDDQRWNASPPEACAFRLSIGEVCGE